MECSLRSGGAARHLEGQNGRPELGREWREAPGQMSLCLSDSSSICGVQIRIVLIRVIVPKVFLQLG